MARRVEPEVIAEVVRLYKMKDARGRFIYSQLMIADHLGIGESTVNRILRRMGSYRDLPERPSEAELEKRAAESARRMAAQFGLQLPDPLPPGPARGAEAEEAGDVSALEKMQRALAREKIRHPQANELLKELEQNGNEPRNPLDE